MTRCIAILSPETSTATRPEIRSDMRPETPPETRSFLRKPEIRLYPNRGRAMFPTKNAARPARPDNEVQQ
ncbi:hypothetical protein [Sagittula salina]|uniref:Uncharacterized protein n=1 Tax=Sagittula salina TaxID=2820268 RepID=A0A940MMZ3_9RHOB|nr:hypothetical protein [Sagittula salina]MBP0481478.1 hypothetical protein [Sagittula salina]